MDQAKLFRFQTELSSSDYKSLEPILHEFDRYLTLRTLVDGYQLTEADKTLWTALWSNRVARGIIRQSALINVSRWFTYLETSFPQIQPDIADLVKSTGASAAKALPRYNMKLQDMENGVVTRFPPEPSGYLHIGHAKAAFLNDYFAHDASSGSLILRFDDTNPRKEKKEFEDSIIHDLGLLGISPQKVTYTSDYFETLYELCQKLISSGKAYAEDTDPKTQASHRRDRLPSKCRDRPAGESLAIFAEMRAGTASGKRHCIRARITYDSSNGALRDPIIYRFLSWAPGETPQPLYRTGWAWQIYPTYDFACPLVDSIEGVTHALRTTEYADRNDQYYWFLEALGLRRVHLWDFARIGFIRTFLSKRKLLQVVATGKVDGWDDPRMPTVRGILRRGLTVNALRQFMLEQGPSRNLVFMDWTILWSMNKKVIDPIAPRHSAVISKHAVLVTITGGPKAPWKELRPKHPKNTAVGTKTVTFAGNIYIDQDDASCLGKDEEITLMSWGNAFVRHITRSHDGGVVTALQCELNLDGNVSRTSKKIHWLAACGDLGQAELWEFDHLLLKDRLDKADQLDNFLNPVTSNMEQAMVDANCAELAEGAIIQLERKGYFRVDKATGQGPEGRIVLFKIPTGGKP